MVKSFNVGGMGQSESDSFFDMFIDAGECRYNEDVSNKLITFGKQCGKKWIKK